MNKLITCFLLLSISILSLMGENRAEEIRKALMDKNLSDILVVAHRGDWRYAPENSLPAIQNAIDMGVDIVELDVQRTKDGQFILMHDETLNRTTTGKGRIDEYPLDSLRILRLRNGCAARTKHPIPTLEEALLLAKGKIMINLDKADRYFDEIFPLLQKTGTVDQIIMKGNKPIEEVKKLYGKYLGQVIYMPIIFLDRENAEEQIEQFIREINPVAFELLFTHDENPLPEKLAQTLKGKTLIWYNTLWDTMAGGHDDDMSLEDPDRGYGHLIDKLGCRIIQTDRPGYLLEYLRRKGYHK